MNTNVWDKYLPIIRILLKKSKSEDQVLQLNIIDFERAGVGKKAGYKFNLSYINGKNANVIVDSPLASNLSNLLLHDEGIKSLFSESNYQINMNNKFQLLIKHIPKADSVDEIAANNITASLR